MQIKHLKFSTKTAGNRPANAGLVQLVEQLICIQRVAGSNPALSSNKPKLPIMKTKISIFIMVLFISTSCITRKYGYRQHRNRVAQKILQYEHSKPYRWGDWKVCIHFSERPKGHWPFND